MKSFVIFGLVLLVGLVAGQGDPAQNELTGQKSTGQKSAGQRVNTDQDVCYNTVQDMCSEKNTDVKKCTAKYGGINEIEAVLQSYANDQLASSYDYLLLSTYFNSYKTDRPGFSKLFRSLSDKAFDNSIKLVKHITKRGGVADFSFHAENQATVGASKVFEVDELSALAKALDSEKKLSKKAIDAHLSVSRHNHKVAYDPEISQFLEEEFLTKQSETIRKLSGYSQDLWKLLLDDNKKALGVYLFDEYLQKQ